MELTKQRGAIPLDLDKPRIVFFDHKATWLLIEKYGPAFLTELYKQDADKNVVLKSMDALAFFLYAGLQADAAANDETFTEEDAARHLRPFTYTKIFSAVLLALTGSVITPPGKTTAAGKAATPAVANQPKTPGPLKTASSRATTSPRRSASHSR